MQTSLNYFLQLSTYLRRNQIPHFAPTKTNTQQLTEFTEEKAIKIVTYGRSRVVSHYERHKTRLNLLKRKRSDTQLILEIASISGSFLGGKTEQQCKLLVKRHLRLYL